MSAVTKPTLKVGLMVTCLVDFFRPEVGFACVKLLENANCQVFVPLNQTCCGQPAFNNGDSDNTRQIAKQVINLFQEYDYLVAPSGSCIGMIRKNYLELFKHDADMLKSARELVDRSYEIISFLTDILGIETVDAGYSDVVTYHDSCSGLRELGIKQQSRKLLSSVKGLQLRELTDCEVCCGFGGTFCVKYPEVSNKMVSDKAACIQASGAKTILAGDLGCLINIAGKLQRLGSNIKVMHIAEVLANMADASGIGE